MSKPSRCVFLMCGALLGRAFGQEFTLANAAVTPSSTNLATAVEIGPPPTPSAHHFWDKKNRNLFVAVAGLDAADFAVTHANLRGGGQELNPIARVFGGSTTGLAINFAGETAGVIGISYLLHKTGHHRLERVVSVVNIGASAGAVAYGLGQP